MRKITFEEFLLRVGKKFGNQYDKNNFNYIGMGKEINIKCPICKTEYKQLARNFIKGYNGCPKCCTSKTTEGFFLERIKEIHKDHYDYSKVKYKNNLSKIELYCKQNNVWFSQTASTALKFEIGCPICSKKLKKSTEQFIKEAKKIHGDRYDYSLINYINSKTKVKIICYEKDENGIKHGVFEQLPSNHIRFKQGCPKCFKTLKKSTEQFIKEAKKIHGDRYDYSLSEYINNKTKIKIFCKKCEKIFLVTPSNHLRERGCPYCKESRGEKKIRVFLEKNKINFIPQKTFSGLKDRFLLSYDFYLPDKNLLIEYNGEQHYKWVKRFHKTIHDFHKQKHHDWLKRKYAKEHNINLLIVSCKNDIISLLEENLK